MRLGGWIGSMEWDYERTWSELRVSIWPVKLSAKRGTKMLTV